MLISNKKKEKENPQHEIYKSSSVTYTNHHQILLQTDVKSVGVLKEQQIILIILNNNNDNKK